MWLCGPSHRLAQQLGGNKSSWNALQRLFSHIGFFHTHRSKEKNPGFCFLTDVFYSDELRGLNAAQVSPVNIFKMHLWSWVLLYFHYKAQLLKWSGWHPLCNVVFPSPAFRGGGGGNNSVRFITVFLLEEHLDASSILLCSQHLILPTTCTLNSCNSDHLQLLSNWLWWILLGSSAVDMLAHLYLFPSHCILTSYLLVTCWCFFIGFSATKSCCCRSACPSGGSRWGGCRVILGLLCYPCLKMITVIRKQIL